ncbi:phage portal protein family protein [Calidifontibacter indicus]|uniref:phage portal protein family protein n=1 Tax=Calidifontibacter indicus TaxID=419650 RepID=UPI003D740016
MADTPEPQTAKPNTSESGHAGFSSWLGSLVDEAETAPELQWPLNILVYDRMRRQESQVVSVLRAVKLPILRAEWSIDPAGADDDVVQLVSEDLGLPVKGRDSKPLPRTRDRFSWNEHLRHALLMLDFGHMFFEQVYRIDATGRARLRKLGPRLPRTLSAVTVADDGGLMSITQHPISMKTKSRPIPVAHLVAYCNEREGGNWFGQSLLRAAYKNWLIKDVMLRVQAQTVDRNGMGVPIYEAAPGETSLDKGLKLATSLRSGDNAGAAIPNGAKLGLYGVDGNLPDADKVIRYHDEQMARAVLAHFLNLGTQTGSWALGSTFADFFTLSLQAVADELADVATQHIVEDLVDINFGLEVPAPRIVCAPINSRRDATAEAIKILVDAGVITAGDDIERFVRSTYGLPAMTPDRSTEPAEQENP